jgi:hypothetical protein
MKQTLVIIAFLFIYKITVAQTPSDGFILSGPGHSTTIFIGNDQKEVVGIVANALADDIKDITGIKPLVTDDTSKLKGAVVILGTVDNPMVRHFCKTYKLPAIHGKWEHFFIRVLNAPATDQKVLLIAGSDARGVAYGVFTLSKLIGVSPWKWWADVTPHKKKRLIINKDIDIQQGPSVKYRGIFLNDEDWGLRPWASKTFEPAVGNIGPKTYAKIFELLLRLKANTIWPAMHPGTTPFFEVKGNEETAKKYDMVIGTSHAEPMLRNNVGEWHTKTMGDFNYITNRDSVYNYWKRRVMQVAGDNDIYTIGMRGIHDSKMEGAQTLPQQAGVLSQVFKDQRGLLEKYVNRDITRVPQVFIPYKEVLPVYDYGLKVPGDVTLMWTDDNYGYIRRLSNEAERRRSGSAGVYYHLSYWGQPHDYLWLSSTQPGLIWEEMKKAWDYGARRIWIANVGDIKPAAYNIQFFMDMAWNIDSIRPGNIKQYMRQWAAGTFGQQNAEAITKVMDEYYRLASIRKPEFMGWSQTEPITPTKNTAFHPFFNGDEIAGRIQAYKKLMSKADEINKNIPDDRKDAYFELVTYPVNGAAYMNQKFLYAQKSRLFAKFDLPVANDYASLSRKAYDSIKILTEKYNQGIANGKWKYIMSMTPRDLPVFQLPELPEEIKSDKKGVLVWLEGKSEPLQDQLQDTLLTFNPYSASHHFIQLFNKSAGPVKWQVKTNKDWIRLNKRSGSLRNEDRIEVSVNWKMLPLTAREGRLTIDTEDTSYEIIIPVAPPVKGSMPLNAVVEQDGHVFIQAYQFIKKQEYSKDHQWTPIQQLGYSDSAYAILPILKEDTKGNNSAYLEYGFYTYSKGPAEITVFTIPTLPVNDSAGMRLALSVDGGQKQMISYKTEDRSEEWKQNVLSNHARCVLKYDFSTPGCHRIKIYPIDPGVVLDQIMISFNSDEKIYAIPEK